MMQNDSNVLHMTDSELSLFDAIKKKDINNVIRFLDSVNISKRDQYGTILHTAVNYNTSEPILKLIIQKFKEKKVSLDITNDSKRNVLDIACLRQYFPAIKILFEAGVDYKNQMPDVDITYLGYFLEKNPDKIREVNLMIEERSKQNTTVINKEQASSAWFFNLFDQCRARFMGLGYSVVGDPNTADTDSNSDTPALSSRDSRSSTTETESEFKSKSQKPKVD